ncbi:MAG: InlB B-repeat-containing protein [Bacilli bacterium]
MPQKQSLANTNNIEINDESANEISVITKQEIKTTNSGGYISTTTQLDESYLIPDLELRKYINERSLRKTGDEIETYSATIEDLESITSLDIYRSSGQMLAFESLEGMQYMTNVTKLRFLRVSFPESGLEYVSQMSSLTELTINDMFFSGSDGTLKRWNISVNGGEVQEEADLPFDQYIDLSPLANLTNLTKLYFTLNGMQHNAPYSYSPRTHFDVSALGTLTNLTQLDLQGMGSVDDPAFSFVESLTNLTRATFLSTPLNDVSYIATLPNLTSLNISETYVTDFTPIIDKDYFTGAVSMKIGFPVNYYDTKNIDGTDVNIVSVDTGINIGGMDSIGFTTISSHVGVFGINNYNYDNTLKVDFNINELKEYNLLNWKTGKYDLAHLGFVWGANIVTENGKNIKYSINTMTIGKKVTFDSNYDGGDSVEILVAPFEAIKEPTTIGRARTHLNFAKEGYELTSWATDPDGIDIYDFSTVQHMNITLYAQWEASATDPTDPTTNPDSTDELPDTGVQASTMYSLIIMLSGLGLKFILSKK